MGWDDSNDGSDDDWDVDEEELEASLKAQERERIKQQRREEGLSSESEREEEKPAQQAAPKPKPKPKPKPQPVVEEILSPEERKLRQRKMEEEQDARLAGDLFSGFEKVSPAEQERRDKAAKEAAEEERRRKEAAKTKVIIVDKFEEVELNTQADVDQFVDKCVKKIDKGKAKDGAVHFLSNLLKQVESTLTERELNDLVKVAEGIVKDKKVQQCATISKENKANTKLSKTTKFNVAGTMEEYYGGGDGDEEWTKEEWDEWYRQQEAESQQ